MLLNDEDKMLLAIRNQSLPKTRGHLSLAEHKALVRLIDSGFVKHPFKSISNNFAYVMLSLFSLTASGILKASQNP